MEFAYGMLGGVWFTILVIMTYLRIEEDRNER